MKNILLLFLTLIITTPCFSQNRFISNTENGYEINGEIKLVPILTDSCERILIILAEFSFRYSL